MSFVSLRSVKAVDDCPVSHQSSLHYNSYGQEGKHLNKCPPPFPAPPPYNSDETDTQILTKYPPPRLTPHLWKENKNNKMLVILHTKAMRKKTNTVTKCFPRILQRRWKKPERRKCHPIPIVVMRNKKSTLTQCPHHALPITTMRQKHQP